MGETGQAFDVGLGGLVGGFPVLDDLVHRWGWVGEPFVFAVAGEDGVVVC